MTKAPQALVLASLLTTMLGVLEVIAPSSGVYSEGFLRLDATSRLFALVINPIFLGISFYIWNRVATTPVLAEGMRRFGWLALTFLAAANVVLIANHLLLLWIALELTTLAAAPLIVRAGVPASRQASWRYLLFSSVGLGLVLVGFMCLARSLSADGHPASYFIDKLPELVREPATPPATAC